MHQPINIMQFLNMWYKNQRPIILPFHLVYDQKFDFFFLMKVRLNKKKWSRGCSTSSSGEVFTNQDSRRWIPSRWTSKQLQSVAENLKAQVLSWSAPCTHQKPHFCEYSSIYVMNVSFCPSHLDWVQANWACSNWAQRKSNQPLVIT